MPASFSGVLPSRSSSCPCYVERPRLHLRLVRPSVTDLRFRGDACVVPGQEDDLVLCVGNYQMARVRGLSFDIPHLNTLVDRLRQPRCF